MMTVDVSGLDAVKGHLKALDNNADLADMLLREIAQGLYAQMSMRIFNEEGTTMQNGNLIGTYNPKYYKRRVKEFGRTNKNVNLIATDQMHVSFSFAPNGNGGYSIGFLNKLAADKSYWNEDRFGNIFGLSTGEIESIQPIINEFMQKNFTK